MKDDQDINEHNRYLSFVGAPFVLIVAPICGYFLGVWLDGYFHTPPYLSYVGLVLGIVSGIREFYKLVKAVGHDDPGNHRPKT